MLKSGRFNNSKEFDTSTTRSLLAWQHLKHLTIFFMQWHCDAMFSFAANFSCRMSFTVYRLICKKPRLKLCHLLFTINKLNYPRVVQTKSVLRIVKPTGWLIQLIKCETCLLYWNCFDGAKLFSMVPATIFRWNLIGETQSRTLFWICSVHQTLSSWTFHCKIFRI